MRIISKYLGRVKSFIGGNLEKHQKDINIGEFHTYVRDIHRLFEYVQGNTQFVGQETKNSLDTICAQLARLDSEVRFHQDYLSRPIDIATIVAKDTYEVRQATIPKPIAIHLDELDSLTINGLTSKSIKANKKLQCLKAQVFAAYLDDISKVMIYLTEKPKYNRFANGEGMLGSQALTTIKEITDKLSDASAKFDDWQRRVADRLTEMPLEEKEFATLRLLMGKYT